MSGLQDLTARNGGAAAASEARNGLFWRLQSLLRRREAESVRDRMEELIEKHDEPAQEGALERADGLDAQERALLGNVLKLRGKTASDVMVPRADIMAMPARTRGGGLDVEGLGIVYLEAQACGVPVVAGDSGGAPETVTEGSGIVVDGNDTDAIAAAVIELLRDPTRRAAMGAAGRAFVGEQFAWDVLGRRLADLLEPSTPLDDLR